MHKNFYASGFLYHTSSQQILLQQYSDSQQVTWSLFSGIVQPNELFKTAFQRIIYSSLHMKLAEETLYDVYDYYNAALEKNSAIVYGELEDLEYFPAQKSVEFTWVNMKGVYKLSIPEQMKHDITVGQRVIHAKQRGLTEKQI